MSRFPVLLALACALLPHAARAQAQNADTRARTSLSLGAFLPTESDTRTRTGNSLFHAELRYAPEAKRAAASRPVLSLNVDRGTRGEGTTLVTATLGSVSALSSGNGASPFGAGTAYAGYGLGAQGLDLNGLHAYGSLAGYAEVGYNITSAAFAQAQYRVTHRGSGVIVTLGARF